MKKADKAVIANEIRSLVLFYSSMMEKVKAQEDHKTYEMLAKDSLKNLRDLGIPVNLMALED